MLARVVQVLFQCNLISTFMLCNILQKKGSVDQDQRITPPPKEDPIPTPSTALSAPSTSKFTKASSSSTTPPAQVPYKPSSLSARISPINSQSASTPSTKHLDSLQTIPIQSQTAPAASKTPSDSLKTTPIQSQTVPVPSTRPLVSFQSPTASAPSSRPIVEAQASLDTSEVIPVSFQTTFIQPQTLPMVVTTVSSPLSSQCTPTVCLTVPKPIPVTIKSLPQNSSQTIQSQVSDLTATITTPVPLEHVPEATTTPILSQTPTIPLSPDKPAPNPVSTPLSTSSSQTAPVPTHASSQTASQIPFAAEVPVSTDLSAAAKSPPKQMVSEQPDSAGVPTPVHATHSMTHPAQPSPSLAPSYPVGFGTPLPYPPYPPYSAPVPCLSPNASAPLTDPCLPPAVSTPPFSRAAESYLYDHAAPTVAGKVEYVLLMYCSVLLLSHLNITVLIVSCFTSAGAGSALVPDPPPQHTFTLAQVCQDLLYPGFPQNEKDEHIQPPSFSHDRNGKDLPSGIIFRICFTDSPFHRHRVVLVELLIQGTLL